MPTIDVTNENFASTVEQEGIVLVDAWAEWCGPCKQFAPIYEQASERHQDVVFAKLDTDSNQEVSAALGIQSIPTLFLFRDGILLFQNPGVIPGEAIDDVLKQAQELDMEDVRRQIAEAQAQQGEENQQ
ncbi:thioredoxin [Corynebacterium sputi]|uniref:thioredoxin n=1 Tax=Corynebacterium sputi TaxID=489915 RepID=UPI0004106B26|nr:thioredoxin [Corynebacterium sputi]